MPVDWVDWTMVIIHARARLRKTLLVRVHELRSGGKNTGNITSNVRPSSSAAVLSRSTATADSLDRSDKRAELIGGASERKDCATSCGRSALPRRTRAVSVWIPFAILSQDSSLSLRDNTSRIGASSCSNASGDNARCGTVAVSYSEYETGRMTKYL